MGWVILRAILAVLLPLLFVGLSALVFIWMERKVAGRIQDRLGPTRVGGKFGWLQTLADGLKLLQKEDIVPAHADRWLFLMAPYIVFIGSFLAYMALPFAPSLVPHELAIGIFYMLAVMSTEVFGVLLAGWSSGSKWSLFGGMREAAQMVSYEVPLAICVVIPLMSAGTLNLYQIARDQAGWFWNWYLFNDPFTFLAGWVYFIVATASVKRAPFDLAEAESELVAGFHTEYSGLRWSFFFMAEYGSMFAVSGICATLFLGGWNGPIPVCDLLGLAPDSLLRPVLGCINFIAKGYFLVFVMMWLRWTLPRLRIDQVMKTCLKYFLPISSALLLGAAVWPLVVPTEWAGRVAGLVLGGVTLLFFVWVARTTPNSLPAERF